MPKLLSESEVSDGSADQLSIVAYCGKLRHGLLYGGEDVDSPKAQALSEAKKAVTTAAMEAIEAEKAAAERKEAEAAEAEAAEAERVASAAAAALAQEAQEKAAEEAMAALTKAAAERAAAESELAEKRAADALKAAEEAAKAVDEPEKADVSEPEPPPAKEPEINIPEVPDAPADADEETKATVAEAKKEREEKIAALEAEKAAREAKAAEEKAAKEKAEEEAKAAAAAAAAEAAEEAAKAVAAAEKAAVEKAAAEKAAAEAEEDMARLTAEKEAAAKTAEEAKEVEEAAKAKAADMKNAAARARKAVATKRRLSLVAHAEATDALKRAADAAVHEEAAVATAMAKAAKEKAEAEEAEDKETAAKAAAEEEAAAAELEKKKRATADAKAAVVAAEAATDTAAILDAEEGAHAVLLEKMAEKAPPTFTRLEEPEPEPEPEPVLIQMPDVPQAFDFGANFHDLEKEVVKVAEATPGALKQVFETTKSVAESCVLHPAPVRMLKRGFTVADDATKVVTRPLLDVTGKALSMGAEATIAAYPHVKSGTVQAFHVTKDVVRDHVIPQVQNATSKTLEITQKGVDSTGAAITSTAPGKMLETNVVAPINEKVIAPVNENVVKPVVDVTEKGIEATKQAYSENFGKIKFEEDKKKAEAINAQILKDYEEKMAAKAAKAERKKAKAKVLAKQEAGEELTEEEQAVLDFVEPDEEEEALKLPPPQRMVRAKKNNAEKHRKSLSSFKSEEKEAAAEEPEPEVKVAPEDATFTAMPVAEQSDQVMEEKAAAAEAVAMTKAASQVSVPVIVPDDFEVVEVVVQKETLDTKLGVVLTSAEDCSLPVVASVKDTGAAADVACQLEGTLMPGDKIVKISALSNVVFLNTAIDCKGEARATTDLLKKAVGPIKIAIERAGHAETVIVDKPKQSMPLGVELASKSDWKHPKVSSVVDRFTLGVAASILKVDDVIISVEAATDDATLETRNALDTCVAAVGFLKGSVGKITMEVHRAKSGKKAAETIMNLAAEAAPEGLATTDLDLHQPHEVVFDHYEPGAIDNKGSFVLSAPSAEAEESALKDLASAPVVEEKGAVDQVVDQVFQKTMVKQISEGIDAGIDITKKVIDATGKGVQVVADFANKPQLKKMGSSTVVAPKPELQWAVKAKSDLVKHIVVVNKVDYKAKLGVTFSSHPGDSHPVVAVLDPTGHASTPAYQLQGKLMKGDRIAGVSGYTHVVELETKAAWSASTTAQFLAKAVGLIKFKVERDHPGGVPEEMTICVVKESVSDKLGIDLVSMPGDKHPTVKAVVDRFINGVAAGKLVPGDKLISVQAATKAESLGTAATIGANGNAASTTTYFISSAIGPITFEVLRVADKEKRASECKEIYTGPGSVLHNTDYWAENAELTNIAAEDIGETISEAELESIGLSGINKGTGTKKDAQGYLV